MSFETLELELKANSSQATSNINSFNSALKNTDSVAANTLSKMDRMTNKVEGAGLSATRSTAAFQGLNKSLGGLPGTFTNIADQLDNINDRTNALSVSAGSAMKSIGALGSAALIASAAMIGWDIGRKIAELTGLDKTVEGLVTSLIDLANAEEDAARAQGLQGQQIALADSVMKKYNLSQEQLSALMKANNSDITAVAGQLQRYHGNLDLASKGLAVNNALLKTGTENSKASKTANDALSDAIKKLGKTQSDAAKDAKQHADELARVREQFEATENPVAALEEKIRQLNEAGIDNARIVAVMGNEISSAFAKSLAAGQPISAFMQKLASDVPVARIEVDKLGIELADLAPAANTATPSIFSLLGSLDGVDIKAEDTTYQVKTLAEKLKDLGSVAEGISGIFGALGNAIGGALGKSINNVGALVSGVGQGFAGFGQLMSGDIIGGIQNLIGGIGKVFSALKNLFGHNWKADAQNIIESIHGITGASEQMQQQVADLAKEIGDADTAFILSLNDIMDDVGVTADNFDQFAQAARDTFSFLGRGQITAAQATDILSGAFERLKAVGTDSFGLINPKMQELIQLSKQFGLEVPEITKFLQEQANVLSGSLLPLIENMTKGNAQGLASILKDAFAALGGGADALATLAPAIDAIKAKLKEMGLTMADVGLGFLNQLNNINKKFPEQVAAINAAQQALVSLSNMGLLTAGRFKTLQDQATSAFDKINKDGKVSAAELDSVRPILATLAQLSLQYGYSLSPATIELLKQAHMWDEVANKPKATGDATQTAMERAADGITKAADAMQKLVDALNGGVSAAQGLAGAVGSIPTEINVDVNVNGNLGDLTSKTTGGIRSRAGLEGVEYVKNNPALYLLHPGEAVLGKTATKQLNGDANGFTQAQSMNTGNTTINIYHSGDSFDSFVEKFKRAVKQNVIEGR